MVVINKKIEPLRSPYSNMKLVLCLIERLDDDSEEMRKNSKIITSSTQQPKLALMWPLGFAQIHITHSVGNKHQIGIALKS